MAAALWAAYGATWRDVYAGFLGAGPSWTARFEAAWSSGTAPTWSTATGDSPRVAWAVAAPFYRQVSQLTRHLVAGSLLASPGVWPSCPALWSCQPQIRAETIQEGRFGRAYGGTPLALLVASVVLGPVGIVSSLEHPLAPAEHIAPTAALPGTVSMCRPPCPSGRWSPWSSARLSGWWPARPVRGVGFARARGTSALRDAGAHPSDPTADPLTNWSTAGRAAGFPCRGCTWPTRRRQRLLGAATRAVGPGRHHRR